MKTTYVTSPLEWRCRVQMFLPPIPLPERRPAPEMILSLRRQLQPAQLKPVCPHRRSGIVSGGRREM